MSDAMQQESSKGATSNGHNIGHLNHRIEVNDRVIDPSELHGMLETLESWTGYTESFLKHIEAAVADSDKNLSTRMQKERETEKVIAKNSQENGRTNETFGGDFITLDDGQKDTVKRSKRH